MWKRNSKGVLVLAYGLFGDVDEYLEREARLDALVQDALDSLERRKDEDIGEWADALVADVVDADD